MIQLKKLSPKNLRSCLDLYDTLDSVQKKQVAPNAVSLAQAYVHPDVAWPRVLVENDRVVGFIMLELDAKDIPEYNRPGHYIWRMMIGKQYQNKGYGTQTLDLIKNKCQKEGLKSLYVSCSMGHDMPYQFYINNGFMDTGYDAHGERYLKLLFDE
jgi:diamine N-acetyltransferase